jgi:hypothetical protein
MPISNQTSMSAIGTSRHSPRRTIFGRSWTNNGQRSIFARPGNDANDLGCVKTQSAVVGAQQKNQTHNDGDHFVRYRLCA